MEESIKYGLRCVFSELYLHETEKRVWLALSNVS